ncbi:hypothetical protein [Sphingomonas sp. 22R3R2A-7]|uniref:hypothetical protein n=1 Tax=Sphingomonas sp. 22R3R2A-7 TaxID=3050230 RepID=UPI002FE16D24
MNEQYDGPLHITSSTMMNGMVAGNLIIDTNQRVMVNGTVTGDVIIEVGSLVEVNGTVKGAVLNKGADVTVAGVVGAVNDSVGVITHVASGAIVRGQRR